MTNADNLPLLPTMGVGSYAAPGWFIATHRLARKGEIGSHDIAELFEDATRVVVADQIDAGVDIVTDGELRRQRFVYETFEHLSGLERVPPVRRLGIAGYDMAPHFIARDVIEANAGLGLVEEFEALTRFAPDCHRKIALPGPLTFALSVDLGERGRDVVIDELVTIVRNELVALASAGADYIQIDEPGLPHAPHGLSMVEAADVINRCHAGIAARIAVHVCFGNNAGRPFADRRLQPLMAAMETLTCEQLMLEFANREMADLDLLPRLAERFDIAAGVIDVKNFRIETAADVARRIEQCLAVVASDKLAVTADCGFSALPRYIARQKLAAMVAGTRLVRGKL